MSLRILIVEDDRYIRESISELLTDEGHTVVCAENGARALSELEAMPQAPDLILRAGAGGASSAAASLTAGLPGWGAATASPIPRPSSAVPHRIDEAPAAPAWCEAFTPRAPRSGSPRDVQPGRRFDGCQTLWVGWRHVIHAA